MANFFKSLFFGESEVSAEEKAARDFDVLKYDGIKALRMGKTAYAVRCFNEALKLREDAEVLEHLVNAYAREDRTEEAVAAAGRLIAVAPENTGFLLLRANLHFVAEHYAEAIADCEKAILADAGDATAYFLQGKAKKAAGDRIGAIVSLSQAIRLKEGFAEAHLLRAEVMFDTKDYKDGLEDAERVVELLPEEENGYLIRGRLQEAMGDGKAAERDFRQVIELNPFNEQAYLELGGLYMAWGQPERAIELFDEAIDLNGGFARAYTERGRARLMLGDKNGSFEDMKRAMELNPDGEESRKVSGTYTNFEDMYKNRPI